MPLMLLCMEGKRETTRVLKWLFRSSIGIEALPFLRNLKNSVGILPNMF